MTETVSNEKNSQTTENIQAEEESTSTPAMTRFLTFVSDGLTFGVNTDQVIEIINDHSIRPLPMVPDYVRGIINLRGQILPIIDMRLRMGKPFLEYTAKTCIIILEIESNIVGIAVDSVAQVLDIDLSKTSPIPIENRQELTNSMISIGDGKVVLLLECEAVINTAL